MRLAILCTLVLAFSTAAVAKDWKDDLQEQLRKEYPARTVSGFKKDIKDPGITLAVRQSGVRALCASSIVSRPVHVRNNVIIDPPRGTTRGETILRIGEQVYVYSVDVDDAEIKFRVITTDAVGQGADADGPAVGERATRSQCRSIIVYQFEKDYLKTADLATVKKAIGSVLASADEVATASQKTIELGQTIDEVEKTFGKPATVIKLGARTIYTYKDIKVTFTDGKVSDVQ